MMIDAAPALASELPVVPPAPPRGGHSEAKIIACIVAEHVSPLACVGLDVTPARVSYIVRRTLDNTPAHAHILEWRRRVDPAEWAPRWNGARRVVAAFYAELPDSQTLPDLYEADFGDGPDALTA